jgi:hypothetical protein
MDKGIPFGLCTERVRGQLSEEVGVTSGVPQRSVLRPLLFLAYVNDIWRNIESTTRFFADDGIIHVYKGTLQIIKIWKILQIDLNWLGEWAVENAMVVNPAKSKAVCFMRARVTEPLSYSLRDIVNPEASSCKYSGIILPSDLSWADQVKYT